MSKNELYCAWVADRVPAYLEGREADAKAVQRALAEDDFAAIQTIAHNMKGTGTSYGFCPITEIGGRMEAAAKDGDRAKIHTCLSALGAYLDRIRMERLNRK